MGKNRLLTGLTNKQTILEKVREQLGAMAQYKYVDVKTNKLILVKHLNWRLYYINLQYTLRILKRTHL